MKIVRATCRRLKVSVRVYKLYFSSSFRKKLKVMNMKTSSKLKECDIVHQAKERLNAVQENEQSSCLKCPILDNKITLLLQENVEIDKEIELKNLNSDLKEKYCGLKKYKNIKSKCKSSKTCTSTNEGAEVTVIGPTTFVETYRLSCCRNSDFSKFTGDLLDIIFGPEILGTSVLKGIAGCQKMSILNPGTISEVQIYVSKKFNVLVPQVRCAIRQKLNVCHKAFKKMVNALDTNFNDEIK